MTKNRILSVGIMAVMSFISASTFGQAIIQTDKLDYMPGETAMITGSGFQPGESVKLQVLHVDSTGDNDTSTAHVPWYVYADENGNVFASWVVPTDEDELGATLKLLADGQASLLHAETIFTDAANSVSPRSGTTAGGTAVTITGSGFSSGASFAIKIGNTMVSATRVSSSTLTAITPAHPAGSVDVTVVINGVDDLPLVNGYTYVCTAPGNFVFNESMGTVATTTSIASHEVANGFDNDAYTMSGTGDVRTSSPSADYLGASGGANIFLATTAGTNFQIAGVNTSGLSNPDLSFGIFKSTTSSDGSDLIVEVSPDGISYSPLSLPSLPAGTGTVGWHYRIASGTIPAASNLRIRFKQNGTTTQYRIDDVRLIASPQITGQPAGAAKCPGESVTFNVAATGTGLIYQWYKESVAPGNEVGTNSNSYTIASVIAADAANYFVVVAGACSPAVTSDAATLSVDAQGPAIGGQGTNMTIDCIATPSFTPPTASDDVSAATVNELTSTTTVNSCMKVYTKTWDATDACGNHSSTVSQIITAMDAQPPVVTCHTGNPFIRSTNAGQCTYKISGTEFDATATGNCGGPPTITWSVSGATIINGTGSMANHYLNFGSNTIEWTATDACGSTATCSVTVNVNRITTTTTVAVTPSSQQYSDRITFIATVTPYNCAGAGDIGGSVTFKVGTQALGSAPVVNGTAILSNVALVEPTPFGTAPSGQMAPTAPGTRTVTACFAGAASDYVVTNPTTSLIISCEDARAYYTGACYTSTSSPTSGSAVVTLSATIKDITAVPGDAAYDPYLGDIRNATVTFINRDNNSIIASNIPVGLVNNNDPTIGTAVYNWSVNISGDAQQFTIGVIVGNYYCRNSSDDDVVITVAKPLPDLFITGGGYLVLTNSAGIKAGGAGSRNNFGFNVKYNNSQTNLQGNINTIIRRMESGVMRVYQVRGNSITSLTVNTGCPKTAVFTGKASIQDITNPSSPVSVEGNAVLQLKITDQDEPGSSDRISITAWNKSGGLWFASNWDGTKTVEQELSGGNVKVHGGLPCLPTSAVAPGNAIEEKMSPPTSFSVKAYPNPTHQSFMLDIQSGDFNDKVIIRVHDIAGRLAYTTSGDANRTYRFGENFSTGIYFIEVRQEDRRAILKLVKQ